MAKIAEQVAAAAMHEQQFIAVGISNQMFHRPLHSPETQPHEVIMQDGLRVVVLYEFEKRWRNIWTDGRPLPKDAVNPSWGGPDPAEPRWWGYSTGKWVDDYTFVAESNGFNDNTWLDNAGRPHSDALHVIEEYKRTDKDHIILKITIDDPKMYAKPWTALTIPLRLQPAGFDIHEMECVPSETAKYNRLFANPAAGIDDDLK